ncbi:MAG TPA: transglutaminase family protein [Acidimicrobiia bacterium]
MKNWVIRVEHHSGYRYQGEVVSSYNEARMTPLTTDRQLTVDSRLEVEPRARPFRYLDYWGSVVDAFDVHTPHTELRVAARSVVETAPAPPPPAEIGWDELRSDPIADRFAEYLGATGYVPRHGELVTIAESLSGDQAPAAMVEEVAGFVASHLSYTPGVTEVSTSAVEAFEAGHGVCQDYAHLTLALLRTMGIPARYVSGYLHPRKDAPKGEIVSGESHAWVEAWVGDWWGFDPTNGVPAGERHVIVGRGRDYADVPPLRGIYSERATPEGDAMTEATGAVDVEVRISRLA